MANQETRTEGSNGPVREPPRLSRTGLVIWLLTPVVIVILMAVLLDWSKAKRRPEVSNQTPPAGARP